MPNSDAPNISDKLKSYLPDMKSIDIDTLIAKTNVFLKDMGGYMVFFLYFAVAVILYLKNPYDLVSKYPKWSILVVLMVGYIFVMVANFAIARDKHYSNSNADSDNYPKLGKWLFAFGSSLVLLIAVATIIYGIMWITANFGRFLTLFTSFTYYLSVIVGVGILYKIGRPFLDKLTGCSEKDDTGKCIGKSKVPQILKLIETFIFYIPCLVIDIIYNIAGTKKSIWILLLVEIAAVALYIVTPLILESKYLEVGHVLASDPQYLNNVVNLDQENLRKILENSKEKLQYALSADIWITPQPTSTNVSYTRDTNLISFGDRLHIEYNGKSPKNLIIKALDGQDTIEVARPEIPLQKWNKVVLNYDHGILDVFLNGKLIHSQQNVPYMTASSVYAGSKRGIHGGIKNVRFFNKALSKNEIDVVSLI